MKNILLTILIFCSAPAYAQDTTNKYGLHIINSIEKLKQTIAADSNKMFVQIKDFVSDVLLDKNMPPHKMCFTKSFITSRMLSQGCR